MTSPIKPLGDEVNENGINNSAVTPNEAVRTPPPVATLTSEPAGGRAEAPQQDDLQITDFLGGKCYLVTGITGFMGTVLVSPRCYLCAISTPHRIWSVFVEHPRTRRQGQARHRSTETGSCIRSMSMVICMMGVLGLDTHPNCKSRSQHPVPGDTCEYRLRRSLPC